MEKSQAERLIVELQQKNLVLPIDANTRRNMFSYLFGLGSDCAVTELPIKQFYLDDQLQSSGRAQYITFRRLIRNDKVEVSKPSLRQRMEDALADVFGSYNSDFFIRELLKSREMIEMFRNCPEQYSLLGKMESLDISTGVDRTKAMPLLIVPGYHQITSMWENEYSLKEFGHAAAEKRCF